jgi:hypothetical protein
MRDCKKEGKEADRLRQEIKYRKKMIKKNNGDDV